MAVARGPWQIEKMEQRCGYLLMYKLWADCTFVVGSKQEVIQAHKLVLAMASSVFAEMFYGDRSEPNKPNISDVQPEAFRAMLKYIYTGNTYIDSLDTAWGLLYGAKKYELPHLVKECNKYICSVLGPSNVCRTYELARLYDEKTVTDKCLQIISTNTKEVLNDSSFEDVELNTLITVCSLDQLNVDSELDLFNAVAKYAEVEQRRQGQISPLVDGEPPSKKLSEPRLEPQASEEKVLQGVESSSETTLASELSSKPSTEVVASQPTADIDNFKKEGVRLRIRPAIEHIRFLSLNGQEFAVGPARSGLLTRDESFAVLMNIATTKSAEPMPSGFSECREQRQPPSDLKDQCFEAGRLDRIINELKCGNPSQVEDAALASNNILWTPLQIQQALDKGILDALGTALTEGNNKCKFYATLAIRNICGAGSPAQLGVLAEAAALQPYCRLLADGGTRYWVLRGLTDMLKNIEENTKIALVPKLREIGVPQLLMTAKRGEAEEHRDLADDILRTYFSGGQ